MLKKFILIICICLIIFPSKVVTADESTAYVSTQYQFGVAYGDKNIKKIVLEEDIFFNIPVIDRTTSLTIDGQGNKLDLGKNRGLLIGKAKLGEVFTLENIRIANYSNKALGQEYGFFETTNLENMASWTFKFKNIKTETSQDSKNGVIMSKLINAPSSLIIFEGDIGLQTRSYLVSGGSILIKEGCKFIGKQIETTINAFYFNNSKVSEEITESTGGILSNDKAFIVEDNVNIDINIENSKYGEVINPNIGEFKFGNNVNFTINNYNKFFRVRDYYPIKRLDFGENCKIDFKSNGDNVIIVEKDNCNVEFGKKSTIHINCDGNVISLKGINNSILFKNPREINLESKSNNIFNIEDRNYIRFENIDLESWNKGNSTESYNFSEEGISEIIFKSTKENGVIVDSNNEELNNYFGKNNIGKLHIKKGLLKQLEIKYINQENTLIGEPLAFDYNVGNIYAEENIPIPAKYLKDSIPANYHYAENHELNGKTQPENICFETGKGVKTLEIYIYGNETNIEIDYMNMKSHKLIFNKKFTKNFGDLLDFRDDEYLEDIYESYYFLGDEELEEGLIQPKQIIVKGESKYTIYIGENDDFKNFKEDITKKIEKIAEKKAIEINNNAGISSTNKDKAIKEIISLKDTSIKNIKNSISKKEVNDIFEKYEKDLEEIKIDEEENINPPINPPMDIRNGEIILVGGEKSLSKDIEKELSKFNIKRISGLDRYETSIEISKEYEHSDTIIIVSGEKFTDELTSTVLSSKLKAPILLTKEKELSQGLIKELKRLKAKNIILVGGEKTISKSIDEELNDYNTKRIGGKDRYETAVLIGEEIRKISGNISKGILVDGTNFPDAVVMSSLASKENIPILLTEPKVLNESILNIIDKWEIDNIIIGGGESSISKNIESKLIEKIDVKRISGINRYETAVNVAKLINGVNNKYIIVNGERFPDAIVASSYGAQKNYPILLSGSNLLPEIVRGYINK